MQATVRTILAAMLMAAWGGVMAWAQEPPELGADAPRIQGNYRGAFTGKGVEGRPLSARVIAESKVSFEMRLFLAPEPGDVEPLTLQARTTRSEGTVFEGEVTLDGATHGAAAKWEDGVITGAIAVPEQDMAFRLERVELGSPTLGAAPPEGARVLLDGTHLNDWMRWPEQWCLTGDGAMEVCGSNLVTRDSFGDAEYHIEFRTPFMPSARGQARGNSGVYVMGRYEVQVLDSFGDPPKDNQCGGIYQVAVPLSNPSLPPLEWQTYDITVRAPRFDEDGNKTESAVITVKHNGEVIHNALTLPEPTPGGVSGEEAPEGPLLLQDHGNPVRYRNIWVRPL